MDFNKQKKILQKLNEEYNKTTLNFNKFVNIQNYVDIDNNIKFNTNYTNQTNTNQSDEKINNEFEYIDLKFNFKRKDLLKIIHPDKINYLINSNQQITNPNIFENNKQLLANCVSNILSNNLNLVDSLILLNKTFNQNTINEQTQQTNIFDKICSILKMTTEQINFIKNMALNNDVITFVSNFDKEIVNFVDEFNESNRNIIDHIKNQLNTIYLNFYIKINSIGSKIIENAQRIISEQSNYEYTYKTWKNNLGLQSHLKEKYKTYVETFNENKFYYVLYENIEHLKVFDIIKLCAKHNIPDAIILNEYLDKLKYDLPYLYNKIANTYLNYTSWSISIQNSFYCNFDDIAKNEYNRFKFKQNIIAKECELYQIDFNILPISETINETIDKPTDETINKPADETIDKPTDETINETTNKIVDELIDEEITKITDELFNKLIDESINEHTGSTGQTGPTEPTTKPTTKLTTDKLINNLLLCTLIISVTINVVGLCYILYC